MEPTMSVWSTSRGRILILRRRGKRLCTRSRALTKTTSPRSSRRTRPIAVRKWPLHCVQRLRPTMRKPGADTHQECRSLLQKAVRRGDEGLVGMVTCHLEKAGDAAWLRGRAAVITFEECWPLGGLLPQKADLEKS